MAMDGNRLQCMATYGNEWQWMTCHVMACHGMARLDGYGQQCAPTNGNRWQRLATGSNAMSCHGGAMARHVMP